MAEPFDPYHRWLGIPPEEQPPHHYRLLGIAPFEPDRQVIDSVAMRHISFLQEITDPASVSPAQQLLNELAAARRCLLDPARKAAYDAALQERLTAAIPPPPKLNPEVPSRRASPADPAPPGAGAGPPGAGPPVDAAVPRIQAPASPVARRLQNPGGRRRKTRVAAVAIGRRGKILFGAAAGFLIMIALGIWSGRTGSQTVTAERSAADAAAGPAQPLAAGSSRPSVRATPKNADTPEPDRSTGMSTPAAGVEPLAEPGIAAFATSVVAASSESTDTPAAAAAPPAPLQIDGLVLWLDAADRATLRCDPAGGVERWADKSGSGFAAEVEQKTQRPTRLESAWAGQPVVEFTGAGSFSIPRTSAALNLGTEYTLIYAAAGSSGPLLSKGSGQSPGSFVLIGASGLRIGSVDYAAQDDPPGTARVLTILADQDALRWFLDGSEHQAYAGSQHAIKTTSVLRIGSIASRGGAAEPPFQAWLAELLVYNRTLDGDQRSAVETYLQEKWLAGEAPPPLAAATPAAPPAVDDSRQSDPGEVVAASSDPASTQSEPEAAAGATPAPDQTAPAADDWQQKFVPLLPTRLEASAGSQLQSSGDGVVLADGGSRQNEVYRLLVPAPPQPITALRLEALPHSSLPGSGPGWGLGGRFSLAEVRACIEPADARQPPQPVAWYSVAADDIPLARRLIDDSDSTSWTISRRGERVVMTFQPATPIGCPEGSWLSISLHQRETLGCFRLSATAAAAPLTLGDPPASADAASSEPDGAMFVNLGGDGFVDAEGNRWEKSQEFAGQGCGHENGTACPRGAQAYPQQPWAETAIRGLVAFRAVVPDGNYELTFCFCEQWTSDAQARQFFVVIERGTPQAVTIPFRGPGLGGPWTHTVRTTVQDGQLDIDFQPVGEQSRSILNAIVIRPRTAAVRR